MVLSSAVLVQRYVCDTVVCAKHEALEKPEHNYCDDGIPMVFLLPHYPEFFLRWG